MKQFTLTLLFTLLPLLASADSVEIDGIRYNLDSTKKLAIVIKNSSEKYSGAIVIPEEVTCEGTEYSVTSIGFGAFYECSGLTSITIPNSVTSIGTIAFAGCRGLTSITIPNSVTSIEKEAFNGCSGLTSITIPNSVTSIGVHVFSECSRLTSITIPNSVTSIGSFAFYNCSGLTSITIPNSVTSIGGEAFSGCSRLTSITIPNSVKSIGGEAFKSTEWYEKQRDGIIYLDNWLLGYKGNEPTGQITISEGTKGIAGNAFFQCTGLTFITIPNSVTSIGDGAFSYCTGLTSVTIPNSVTSIGESAFYNCSGLTSITIPNSVTSIGSFAFAYCSRLTSITIPNSVTSIGVSAFKSTEWYEKQCDGILYLDNWLLGFKGNKPTGQITISEGTKGIAGNAFYQCTGLASITIPNSVTSIGVGAFLYCSGLTHVTCFAESVPSTSNDVFSSSSINNATLHVWASAINAYKAKAPWSEFGTIVKIGDANDDGEVNVADIVYVANIIKKGATEAEIPFADIDGDGEVSIKDIEEIAKIIMN